MGCMYDRESKIPWFRSFLLFWIPRLRNQTCWWDRLKWRVAGEILTYTFFVPIWKSTKKDTEWYFLKLSYLTRWRHRAIFMAKSFFARHFFIFLLIQVILGSFDRTRQNLVAGQLSRSPTLTFDPEWPQIYVKIRNSFKII